MNGLSVFLESENFGLTIAIWIAIGVFSGVISNIFGEKASKIGLILGDAIFGSLGAFVFGCIGIAVKNGVGISTHIMAFIGASISLLILKIVRAEISRRGK